MKNKFYDRSEALEMLFELEKQGYHAILEYLPLQGGLYIYCPGGRAYQEYPDIEGDFVAYWATDIVPDFLRLKEVDYWWLFD